MRGRMSASLSVCPTGMDTHLLVPSARVTHCLGCCSAICGGFATLGGGDDGGDNDGGGGDGDGGDGGDDVVLASAT